MAFNGRGEINHTINSHSYYYANVSPTNAAASSLTGLAEETTIRVIAELPSTAAVKLLFSR